MADGKIPPGAQHPEEYRRDLNPDALAGENRGPDGDRAIAPLTADEIKEAHERLPGFTNDELRRIPVLRAGERLDQGATYIDMAADCTEFTATGDMVATEENWFVRKDTVDYQLWNRLIGVKNPERLGTGNA